MSGGLDHRPNPALPSQDKNSMLASTKTPE
jgi:hypothetical protein